MINRVVSESWARRGRSVCSGERLPGSAGSIPPGSANAGGFWHPGIPAEQQLINSGSSSCQIRGGGAGNVGLRPGGTIIGDIHLSRRGKSGLAPRPPSMPSADFQKVRHHGGIRRQHCKGNERVCVFLTRCLLLVLLRVGALRSPGAAALHGLHRLAGR